MISQKILADFANDSPTMLMCNRYIDSSIAIATVTLVSPVFTVLRRERMLHIAPMGLRNMAAHSANIRCSDKKAGC